MMCDGNGKGKRKKMWRETDCSGCKVERKVKPKAGQHEKRTAVCVKGENKMKLKAGQHLSRGSRASRHPPSTHRTPPTAHHLPIDRPTITAVQQQNNNSGAARTDQSITAAYSSHTADEKATKSSHKKRNLCAILGKGE